MNFGLAVRTARMAKEWPVEKLASEIGMTPFDFTWRIENDREAPQRLVAERIAAALDMPLTTLLFLAVEDGDSIEVSTELRVHMQELIVKLLGAGAQKVEA